MSVTHCFVTKHHSVTNMEIEKIETELIKSNFGVIEKIRLGSDGVVLKVLNFLTTDFSYLEQELALDINFSTKVVEIKKLLVADMDSTIIKSECINEIAEYAGVQAEVIRITEKAMIGKVDFTEALKLRVKLLKGLTVKQLNDCYRKKIHFNKGAKTLVRTMKSFGSLTAIVSGGFSFFADKVGNDIGFDKAYANQLIFEDNMLSGTVENPILGPLEKQKILQNLCAEGNIDLCDVIAVGDGANDIDMIRSAGVGVSYHGKPKLTAKSDFKLYHSNLRALLYLQGIKESEFVID